MTSKKHGSVLNILQVRKDLGKDVCRPIQESLGLTLKKVKHLAFGKDVVVFSYSATICMIEKSGKTALLSLYSHSESNLNCLRYQKFCKKTAR